VYAWDVTCFEGCLWFVVRQLSSAAAARLHNIVQERPVEKLQESCFIVGSIERILSVSVDGMTFTIPPAMCIGSHWDPGIKGKG